MPPNRSPLIIGFVADLMLEARIEATASKLGFEARWIEQPEQVASFEPGDPDQPVHLLMNGIETGLIDQLSLWQPALILFDLGNSGFPWREWIARIKSSPATRRLPVVCFGPHVQAQTLKAARSAGAEAVLARSQFLADLPGVIQKYARTPDYQAIELACQALLSPLAIKGIELFNHGEFFEAHEELEHAWNEDTSPGRELYRAILQVSVAYLQIERGNFPGAVKMFQRLRQWIDPLPEECRGVEVARLREQAHQVYQALLAFGPQRINEFDRRLFRPVIYRKKDMQTVKIPEKYLDLFQKCTFAHLATLMPDGSPQVTPVWIDYDGEYVLVNSARGRQKDRNMLRDAHVALEISDPDDPYRFVQVRGVVEEITEQGAAEHIEKLSHKYTGGAYGGWAPGMVRVIYKIRPEHVSK
jgi:PPOX class probable F420-dependent enzyme